MTDNTKATAAKTEIVLGDRKFFLSPMTQKDIAELDNYVRSKIMQTARESLDSKASDEQRRMTEDTALRIALSTTWMSGQGLQIINTVEGWARILWQGISKNHPEITVDEIGTLLLDQKTLDNVQRDWEILNGVSEKKVKRQKVRRKT